MNLYNRIKEKSVDTREVWTELVRSESEISEEDAVECFRHFREPARKTQQIYKNDNGFEELCQNVMQTLREILRVTDQPPAEELAFLYTVKNNPKHQMLWNSIDLILKFHKFRRVLQSDKYLILIESLPTLERLLPNTNDFKIDDYQLFLISKMNLIISIYYLNLYGVTMRQRMHKLVRKSLSVRQHIHQKWPNQMSILQLPTYIAHAYMKVLRLKKADRDYQRKLLFTLKKNLARLLYKRRDNTLEKINNEINVIIQQLNSEPKLYSQSLSTSIKKSNSLYNFSTVSIKRSKLMSNNSNVLSVLCMIKKHREISASRLNKATSIVANNLRTAKTNLVFTRREPQDRLRINSLNFGDAETYFKEPRRFVFKTWFSEMLYEVSTVITLIRDQEVASGQVTVQFRNVQSGSITTFHTFHANKDNQSAKPTPKQIIIKCLKQIFPLSDLTLYLPLIQSSLSDFECYQKALESLNPKISELQITHLTHVKFMAFIKDLIVQGFRTSVLYKRSLIGCGLEIKSKKVEREEENKKQRRIARFFGIVNGTKKKIDGDFNMIGRGIIRQAGYAMMVIKKVEHPVQLQIMDECIRLTEGQVNYYLTSIVQSFMKEIRKFYYKKRINCYYYLRQIMIFVNQLIHRARGIEQFQQFQTILQTNVSIGHELPIDQAFPSTNIEYHLPDLESEQRKQQVYKFLGQRPKKILSLKRVWVNHVSKFLVMEVVKNESFRVIKVHGYNTFFKMPIETQLQEYQFQFLRLQMYERLFAIEKGKAEVLIAQTKPSILFNLVYQKSSQLCLTRFNYDSILQVLKTKIVKVKNRYLVVNIYKSQKYFIYQVYDSSRGKKLYARHSELFESYEFSAQIKVLNGIELQINSNERRDIRYCYCEAKGYAESKA